MTAPVAGRAVASVAGRSAGSAGAARSASTKATPAGTSGPASTKAKPAGTSGPASTKAKPAGTKKSGAKATASQKAGSSDTLSGQLLGQARDYASERGKKAARKQADKIGVPNVKKRSRAQRILIAELLVCLIVVSLSPLTKTMNPRSYMKRVTAIMASYLVLGLIAAIGDRAGKAAAAFGAIIALGILVDQRSTFVKATQIFGTKALDKQFGPDEPEEEYEERLSPRPGYTGGN